MIPLPTYLFDNDELKDLRVQALAFLRHCGEDDSVLACIAAVNTELRFREMEVQLVRSYAPRFRHVPALRLVKE